VTGEEQTSGADGLRHPQDRSQVLGILDAIEGDQRARTLSRPREIRQRDFGHWAAFQQHPLAL
jgi:hypothetical protein